METIREYPRVTFSQGEPLKLENDVQFHHDVCHLFFKETMAVEEICLLMKCRSEQTVIDVITQEREWHSLAEKALSNIPE